MLNHNLHKKSSLTLHSEQAATGGQFHLQRWRILFDPIILLIRLKADSFVGKCMLRATTFLGFSISMYRTIS